MGCVLDLRLKDPVFKPSPHILDGYHDFTPNMTFHTLNGLQKMMVFKSCHQILDGCHDFAPNVTYQISNGLQKMSVGC